MGNNYQGPLSYQLYKPTQAGTGGALALSYSYSSHYQSLSVYLKIAKQMGSERSFDWQNATVIMLGMNDIAGLLNAIRTRTELKLFHDSSKVSKAIRPSQKTLNVTYNEQYNNFYFQIGRKELTEGGQTVNVGCPVTLGEAAIIETLLRWVLPYLLKWDQVRPGTSSNNSFESSEVPSFMLGDETEDLPFVEKTPSVPTGPSFASLSTEQKTERIKELAVLKLGASREDAEKRVMEETKMAFIESNLDAIHAALMMK